MKFIAGVTLLFITLPASGTELNGLQYARLGTPITPPHNDSTPIASATDHDCWCVGGSAPNNACMTPQDCRDTGGRCTMDDRCKMQKK